LKEVDSVELKVLLMVRVVGCVLAEKCVWEDGKVGREDGGRRGFMAGSRQEECQSWRMNLGLA
jgi:hypothetical protein